MRPRFAWVALALLVPFAGTATGGTPEENKAVFTGFVAACNAHDFDRLDEFLAADVVRHCQATPDFVVRDREGFRAFLEADAATCPDAFFEVKQLIAEDDLVAAWATYHGTQTGPMGPFPPSGREVSLDVGGVMRLEDGKIAEVWVTWDNMAALTQLGHFPPPGKGARK